MSRYAVPFGVALALLFASEANAAVSDQALAAYHAGSFEVAAELSLQEGSADSYAFAAQAIIAEAISRPEGFCGPCLLRAEQLADQAIAIDPAVIDGYLQNSVAIGFRGRVLGLAEAQHEGLAEKARQSIDQAMNIDPHNVWARASLGAWHLEIVHHAGRILANLTYGASRKEGLKLYRAALAERPDAAVLHFQYALSILALDADEFKSEAERELRHTLAIGSNDALINYTQTQAARLLTSLQEADPEKLQTLVSDLQGYTRSGNSPASQSK